MNVAAEIDQELLINGTRYVSANTAARRHGYVILGRHAPDDVREHLADFLERGLLRRRHIR
jgi:hypothetical protein